MPIHQIVRDDIISVKDNREKEFEYETFFDEQIQRKKMDHSYRIFKKASDC